MFQNQTRSLQLARKIWHELSEEKKGEFMRMAYVDREVRRRKIAEEITVVLKRLEDRQAEVLKEAKTKKGLGLAADFRVEQNAIETMEKMCEQPAFSKAAAEDLLRQLYRAVEA